MMEKLPYSVPEGYFSTLNERLEQIPNRVSPLNRVKPYLMMAACFASAVLIGGAVMRLSLGEEEQMSEFSQFYAESIIPLTDPYSYFELPEETSDIDDGEAALEYLIDGQISLDELEYLLK